DATQTAASFKAVITWGNGHVSNGAVSANAQGGFDVTGTNLYDEPGVFATSVELQDFSGNVLTVTNTIRSVQVVIATGPDAGGGPEIKVFDSTGKVLRDFLAYSPSFTGGVRVAVGDITADAVGDIVTVPGPGGGPDVHIYDGKTGLLVGKF